MEKIFLEPEVDKMTAERFGELVRSASPSKEGIIRFMCEEHDFSRERIEKYADKFVGAKEKKGQKGIGNWM